MNNLIETFTLSQDNPVMAAIVSYEPSSKQVFREEKDTPKCRLGKYEYIPWGADNQMPYDIIDVAEKNSVVRACQRFDSEATYGQGLHYDTDKATEPIRKLVESFSDDNNLPLYYLGVCSDLKMFDFCVTVITLSGDRKSIAQITRREAVYCRFAPKDEKGRIPYLLYGQWRNNTPTEREVERISILDANNPLNDLQVRLAMDPISKAAGKKPTSETKFAIVTRVPSFDSTYYPIPSWATILRDQWYDIYRLISMAKYAKLKNAAPLKYIITINEEFWDKKFQYITDEAEREKKASEYKKEIIEFLTGAENSGKAIFAGFYVDPNGKEQPDIRITPLDTGKEGGDWETDIQEAINMICFSMGVHSNLVGSVPGKAQTNNSGSDKRELYTIAQTRQTPYHHLLFQAHKLIIRFNQWENVKVECPIMQLTTLDEHKDAKQVNPNNNSNEEETK